MTGPRGGGSNPYDIRWIPGARLCPNRLNGARLSVVGVQLAGQRARAVLSWLMLRDVRVLPP